MKLVPMPDPVVEAMKNDVSAHNVKLALSEVCYEAQMLSADLRMMTLITERLFINASK